MTKIQEGQKIEVVSSSLEYHFDSINFEVVATFSSNVNIGSDANYELQLIYHPTQGDSVTVGKMNLNGAFSNKEKTKKQSFKIPYKKSWDFGELLTIGTLSNEKETHKTPMIKIADGIITTSQLIRPAYYLYDLPYEYQPKTEYEPKEITLFFSSNSSVIDLKKQNSISVAMLESWIAKGSINGEAKIIATHDPSAKESESSSLTKQRASSATQLLKEISKKYGDAKSPAIKAKSVFQDWSLFSKELEKDALLTKAEKLEISKLVDGGGDFNKRDEQFKKLKYYKNLQKGVYTKLRQVKLKLNVAKKQLSESEVQLKVGQIASGKAMAKDLKMGEILFGVSKMPSEESRTKIYEETDKVYSSPIIKNNLGKLYLEKSEKLTDENQRVKLIEKSIILFKEAQKLDKNPHIAINLAGAQIAKNDQDAAIQTILDVREEADSTLIESINALKGYVYLKRANYAAAIKEFSKAGESSGVYYNQGMAYLLYASQNQLKSGYPSAERVFLKAIKADKENSYAYYALAISAARLEDERLLEKYLKEAVSRNKLLRKRARTDLEFAPFRMSDAFKSAFEEE
ncbi:MAG: tetratricopeptide (TPR) repeat protein [Flammeovirgaceae bacterium]|jgi:tetratricopeptide (TPR) repeat protein